MPPPFQADEPAGKQVRRLKTHPILRPQPRIARREAIRQHSWHLLWESKLSPETVNQSITALKFLYLNTLEMPWTDEYCFLYISRWLTAPAQDEEGRLTERGKGTPQGGVISPLLANLFLHYTFDVWMRYADDAIVHGRTEAEAQEVRAAISARMEECRLGASGEDEGCLLQG